MIPIDGWEHSGTIIYPETIKALESDVWLHVAYGGGWVSFPGVRGAPTAEDPTGLSADPGKLAELIPKCEIK